MSELEPVPPEIAALLERARHGAPAPSLELQEAVLRRVVATVNGGPASSGPGDSGSPGGAAGGAGSSASGALFSSIAIIVAIGLGAVIAVSGRAPRNPDAPAAAGTIPVQREALVVQRGREQVRRAPAPTGHDTEQAPSSGASAVRDGDSPHRDHQNRPRRAERSSAEDALAAETALIDGAALALRGGDIATASAHLATHARRYPRGQLTEEREAIRVKVSFAAGDAEEARGAARAFLARYPRSAHRAALEQMARSP